MRVLPYKMASASGKALATALGSARIRKEGAPLNLRQTTIINWGCSTVDRELTNGRILNTPENIARAVNKLSAFNLMEEAGVPLPRFTEDREEALGWLQGDRKVVCRTQLSSYGGAGIVIAANEQQLVQAPLYVVYVPKEQEYRVHATPSGAFFVQRKARRLEVPDDQVNWQIRNLEGGFIYANQNVEVSQEVKDAAVAAIRSLSLDFGAVDLVVTARNRIAVLEVNTACGLAGTTLDRYVEMFRSVTPQ